MRLVSDVRAGSVIYTDNFYTSETLATSLRTKQISLVGTVRANRTGFPAVLRTDMKQFEKHAERGATRYVRNGDHLYQQWKDKRCVSMYSNIHQGHEHDTVTRNVKIDGAHQQMEVQRPMCIRDYNSSMGGVDTFDQLIETHRVLRKTKKYWKNRGNMLWFCKSAQCLIQAERRTQRHTMKTMEIAHGPSFIVCLCI
eukprot:scpid59228/ scgid1104/ PiggyBac transposable element-derived protein 4